MTVLAALVLLAGAVSLTAVVGWRQGALWTVGALLGVALYHAAFGFTYGFRVFLRERRSAHLRAQMLMLGVAVLLFFPLLAADTVFGVPVRGFVFPVGVEVALGAFVFGIGMQLGGGCASGTLYTAGGGSTRMLVTLASFIAGATLAAFTYESWSALPDLAPISLPATFGTLPALAANLAVFGLVWWAVGRIETARHGAAEPIFRAEGASLLRGPWPYAWGAIALAVLNAATLVLAGRPWGITSALTLWGSTLVDRLGLDEPAFWAFWEVPARVATLHRPLWADVTSVMNVAIMLGALTAAVLAGRFAPEWRVPLPHLAASVIGGTMLGVGAVMATGCNIGAYFSGIASGSVHGWLWIAAAIVGNALGTRLRPLFRLDPNVPTPSVRTTTTA